MNKSFKIMMLDHEYDVEFSPTNDNWGLYPVDEGGSAVMGNCSISQNRIKVNTLYDEGGWLSTFCHELAHIFLNRFSYPLEEHVIDIIGMGMHSLLLNNLDEINELYNPDICNIVAECDELENTVRSLMEENDKLKKMIASNNKDITKNNKCK